jgi:hypothetical protein
MRVLPAAVLSLGVGAVGVGTFYGFGHLVESSEVVIVQNCAKQLGSTALDASKWLDDCKDYTPTGVPSLLTSDESTGNRTLTYTLPGSGEYLAEALPEAEQRDASAERVINIGSGVMGLAATLVMAGVIGVANQGRRQPQRLQTIEAQ